MSDFDFSGTAIVTGSAGGIGRSLVRQLASRGCDIALVDRDESGLDSIRAELWARYPHQTFTTYVADLSDRSVVRSLGVTLATAHPDTRLLVNNAGVALSGSFEQCGADDFDWLVSVNLLAPIDLVRALLPVLRTNRTPHIVNVSSVFGLVAPAGNVAYSTSKFGVRGFTEALRAELAPTGIGVTCVHPGGIKTAIALTARIGSEMTETERTQAAQSNIEFDKVLSITADQAASTIMAGIERRRPRVLIGMSAKIPDVVARLFPTHYHQVVNSLESLLGALSSRRESIAPATTVVSGANR
ncbi:SDR family NAD(P)-dependent oxidoreductase [Rhodococcus sp. IEGM 1354]|uniref:SDR family NAD(P)-dependent oxidoreductase n=1 Tax=Rhodococcus sp. IEGM 1354 TaxID=3047088 RepID=UPI0024B67DA7|nr:SDR family NAD(P)-dependent oxidoreductase [Rhodococcus sp. IEGM 1354]MDI9930723.1 SDR family NAD(P)-dependent oxidoreductase [Rhodococcus sp. IEGM 1354]